MLSVQLFVLQINIMNLLNITPQYILGFVDAEGMFGLIVQKSSGLTGYKFSLEFKVTQKFASLAVLEAIKGYFGCGRIAIDNRRDHTMKYVVTDFPSIISVLIPFFLANQLLSSKYLNFLDFVRMAEIIRTGRHLTVDGAQSLLLIYSQMNSKRSWLDKYTFMSSHTFNITSGWLQGFIDGDGGFTTWLGLSSSTRATRHNVLQLFLEIKQNSHDVFLLQAIILFLGVGSIKPKFDIHDVSAAQAVRPAIVLVVRQTDIVISFVDKYPMLTTKQLDYECWKQLYELRKAGMHLTPEGLILINQIRSGMNSKRVNS